MPPKAPTISLPFTTFDEEHVTKTSLSSLFNGSRLRNRALAIAASILGFFLFLYIIHRAAYGGSTSMTQEVHTISKASGDATSAHVYEGVETTLGALDHLIVVAGHAIWLGGVNYTDEAEWILESFQVGQSGVFVDHIAKGASLAKEDPKSLLIFSGGETRPGAPMLKESQSYAALFHRLVEEGVFSAVQDRVTTEEFARDSYENLIFSVARFFEVTDRYPTRISVVGFEFKRERFVNIHRKAIQFPDSQFTYHGIDPAGMSASDVQGESSNARTLFDHDLYACKDETLLAKKKGRNPSRRRHGYELSNPQISRLLTFCPQKSNMPYESSLPWKTS